MTTQLTVECIHRNSLRYTDLLTIAYDIAYEKSTSLEDMALTLTDRKPAWFNIDLRNADSYLYFIIETEEDDDGEIPS